MRNLFFLTLAIAAISFASSSCTERKATTEQDIEDSLAIADPDTTVYGICGESTTMHSLQLITDDGRVMNLLVDTDNEADNSTVKGGLLAGDRMAVTIAVVDGDSTACTAINLTTLTGRWTSIDRNFEIVEGGEIISAVQSETDPYTSWKIHNGSLLMGRDTFSVLTLGADSLEIESSRGIYVYKRQK